MYFCPCCGSENWKYLGISDGGGDTRKELCDVYECLDCGKIWEANCVEEEDDVQQSEITVSDAGERTADDNLLVSG